MAKLKLPEQLKAWKIVTPNDDGSEIESYTAVRKNDDGSKTEAKLTYFELIDELYTDEDVAYLKEEADFLNKVKDLGDFSNYLEILADDDPDKERLSLYILTENYPTLAEKMENHTFSDDEVVDFGLQMGDILETLENNNILHGNLNPGNIFVTEDGRYKLGGFVDAEGFVDDLSYIAPEIHSNGKADLTTDIYSLGLIMYAMKNGGKLPFEQEASNREDATARRLQGNSVTPPADGSQKLKSVIMIAIQPKNEDRWKNAGNIKAALRSMQEDDAPEETPGVIAPESTEFDGNVFDEASDSDGTGAAAVGIAAAAGVAAAGVAAAGVAAADAAEQPEPDIEEIKPSYEEPEIDNRVFDDYTSQTKVFSISQPEGETGKKDYGDFFDDDPEPSKPDDNRDNFDVVDPFATDEPEETKEEKKKKKKKGIVPVVIIGIIALLALLTALGVIAYQNGMLGGTGNTTATEQETTEAVAATTQAATKATATTQKSSTAPSTTAPATTKSTEAVTEEPTEKPTEPVYVVVPNVRGMSFERAEQALEEAGLSIRRGATRSSDEYEEGLVIAMTPGDGHSVEKGTTVIVDVSSGLVKPESSQSSQSSQSSHSSQSSQSDDSYSSSRYSTGYLSQSEVSSMDRGELNLALNEIYARHGRIFTDPDLNAYFRSQSWYTPRYSADEFSQRVVFNDYESKNINLILNEQTNRGLR